MQIWIFDDEERWPSDTDKYGDKNEIEADLERDGHTWRGARTLFVSLDLIRKMAGSAS